MRTQSHLRLHIFCLFVGAAAALFRVLAAIHSGENSEMMHTKSRINKLTKSLPNCKQAMLKNSFVFYLCANSLLKMFTELPVKSILLLKIFYLGSSYLSSELIHYLTKHILLLQRNANRSF